MEKNHINRRGVSNFWYRRPTMRSAIDSLNIPQPEGK